MHKVAVNACSRSYYIITITLRNEAWLWKLIMI